MMTIIVKTRRKSRVVMLFGAVVLVLALGLVGYFWHQNGDAWHRIRSRASQFNPPPEWTLIGKAQEGSQACIVSCDSPRVTLVYRTTAGPLDACDEARAAIDAQIGPAPIDARGGCGWQAHIPSGGRAYVVAGAEPASELRGVAPSWTAKIPPTGDGTLVWLEFNSGLD
jgi:hypothetical protein